MTHSLTRWLRARFGGRAGNCRKQRRHDPVNGRFESLELRELLSISPLGSLEPWEADAAIAMAPQPLEIAAQKVPSHVELPTALARPAGADGTDPTYSPPSGKIPYGATYGDTSEFMIGDVSVTVVLLESDGTVDAQSEDWTSTEIAQVKSEILEGLQWWEDTFRARNPNTTSTLDFRADFTFADNPVRTRYEPIRRSYTDQSLWIDDFLNQVGYNSSSSVFTDLDRWNNDRRVVNNSDWAFTVFVVDSSADTDGKFSDGYFAYSYIGGPFNVMTYDNNGWGISRMGQVFAHETGHIFYALDEYPGSNSYASYSGYYNTQNLNAADGNPNPSSRVASIMAEAALQGTAYTNHTSSPTSLQMIGWKDTDGDGILDVLDVPLTLTGTGAYNAATGRFDFSGASSVQTLTNLNPRGSKHSVTINTVDQIQYRVDGGAWAGGNTYHDYSASVSQSVPVSAGTHTLEFRTVCLSSGVTSPIWSSTFTAGTAQTPAGVVLAESGGTTAVTEGGTSDTYTIKLAAQPTADVVVTIAAGTQLTAAPTTLTFTPSNWSTAQTVTVAAVNDTVVEGPHQGLITHSVASTDARYQGLGVSNITVAITDNDTATAAASMTLKTYNGTNTRPTVEAAGTANSFKVGGRVVNDRSDTWTRVPAELAGQMRLLTARADRRQSPVASKYVVTLSEPGTLYLTLDPRYNGAKLSWMDASWTKTTMTADSSGLAGWAVWKKTIAAPGDLTLGCDTGTRDGVTYVFVPGTTTLTAPAAPAIGFASAISTSQVNLTWSDQSNNESGFKIERKLGIAGTWTQIAMVGANVTSYQDNGLATGTTYYYRVRATNSAGDSPYSAEAAATTASYTIATGTMTVKTYNGTNTAPTVEAAGAANSFKLGALVSNDRPDTWTRVPAELAGQMRLLTARSDRQQSPVASKYVVNLSGPGDLYLAVDPRYAGQKLSWMDASWTTTTLTADSTGPYGNQINWTIWKKSISAAGDVTLGADTGLYDGITAIFVPRTAAAPDPLSSPLAAAVPSPVHDLAWLEAVLARANSSQTKRSEALSRVFSDGFDWIGAAQFD